LSKNKTFTIMNAKKLLLYSCALLCAVGLPSAFAQTRGHASSHPSVATAHSGTHWNRGDGRWHDGANRFHDRDRDHRFFVRTFVFFGGFGYPYFGYPYPYTYGYYPYAYYPPYYYSAPPVYEGRYVAGYRGSSLVIQVQERLARAGYYHGAIDGVIGNGTRRAIRGYERANRLPVDGRIDPSLLATMGLA
jgi:hypothetical protein